MRYATALLIFALCLCVQVSSGYAVELRFNTTGYTYCANEPPQAFDQTNDINLAMYVEGSDPNYATLYRMVGAIHTFVADMTIETRYISGRKRSFNAYYWDVDFPGNYAVIVGTYKLDNVGRIKTMKGTSVQSDIIIGCFSTSTVAGYRVD